MHFIDTVIIDQWVLKLQSMIVVPIRRLFMEVLSIY